jgi:penicillin-binding protein 1C
LRAPSRRVLRWLGRLALAGALLVACAWGLDRAFPPDLSRLSALGTEVVDREGRTLALLPASGGVWRFRAGPGDVSPDLTALLVATEDRRFWWHPGVDPVALVRAVGQFVRAGRVVSGGSTIAMQAARLLEPRPRTMRSKLIEMARAVQLEWRYGRRGVLGIWLTLAPYGGNLEGVRAGAMAWLGHGPEALEPAEAALLVALPRRPEGLRPDRHAAAAFAVRGRVLDVGVRAALFERPETPPVPTARVAMPRHAAQIVAHLAASSAQGGRVATTLDLGLQVALERLAAQRVQTLPPRTALAALVLDARSGEVRAAYGGAWGDQGRAGALDLTRAIRSPGSALKPFIYALAFQDGVAGPETVLADLPRLFGTYAPENFDRAFTGGVTAAEALRQSLNLPAVELLEKVGPLRFAQALRLAGAPLRLPAGATASLPLALGGGGTTLREAAGLYAALATDGAARPPRVLAGEAPRPLPFLQRDAAATVASVLTRPFPGATQAPVAWKTGTSWGGRDAWAFGFDARHVGAVWIGRPDGTPMTGSDVSTGAGLALPFLARVFDLLPPAPRPAPERLRSSHAPPVGADALRLLFPPPNAVVSGDGPLTLRAMGGRRPLTFLVDGTPIPAEAARRETSWLPPGPGFYRLTVLDADGAAAHVAVRVR